MKGAGMSSLFSMGLPGRIRTAGAQITPDELFRGGPDKAEYMKILDGSVKDPAFRVKKVNVKIFDLSDEDQVKEYEELWKDLLEKSARMEVVVDSRKDLVHRSDGTSYWMKYVEYVEFCDSKEDAKSSEGK